MSKEYAIAINLLKEGDRKIKGARTNIARVQASLLALSGILLRLKQAPSK